MKIFIIGYMASGKSRLGWELSKRISYPFIDIDELFEEKYRITILDFFEKYEEQHFRKIERELLRETFVYKDAVISTGGGTPCFFDNMEMIKQNGISIYLKMSVPALVSRLKLVRKKRPLIKGRSLISLEEFVGKQIIEREVFYRQADFTVAAENITVDAVLKLLPWVQPENE